MAHTFVVVFGETLGAGKQESIARVTNNFCGASSKDSNPKFKLLHRDAEAEAGQSRFPAMAYEFIGKKLI